MRSVFALIFLLVFLAACTPASDDADVDHDHMMDDEPMIEEEPHEEMMDENERQRLDSLKNRDMMSSINFLS